MVDRCVRSPSVLLNQLASTQSRIHMATQDAIAALLTLGLNIPQLPLHLEEMICIPRLGLFPTGRLHYQVRRNPSTIASQNT